jgi:hypothetical protein
MQVSITRFQVAFSGAPKLCRTAHITRSTSHKHVHIVKSSAEGAEGISETGIISGEWSANWSLASYDDVLSYFSRNMLTKDHAPSTRLSDIMQTRLITCRPNDSLADLKARNAFATITGMPVVREEDGVLIGVISKSDLSKPGNLVSVSIVFIFCCEQCLRHRIRNTQE